MAERNLVARRLRAGTLARKPSIDNACNRHDKHRDWSRDAAEDPTGLCAQPHAAVEPSTKTGVAVTCGEPGRSGLELAAMSSLMICCAFFFFTGWFDQRDAGLCTKCLPCLEYTRQASY